MQPGTLFYAVGASGAGKDALIKLPISSASSHIAYLPEDSRIVEAKAYAEVGRIDIAGRGVTAPISRNKV